MSTGIDIVKISRLEKFPLEKFAQKILSEEEQALPQAKNISSMAASFAAKEAFSKALGTGIRGFELKDVSVIRNSLGKPYLKFSSALKAKLDAMGVVCADVTISHEKEYAVAVVNLEFDRKKRNYDCAIEVFEEKHCSNAITPDFVRSVIPVRKKDMHKGDCGRCFIVAGSTGLSGAAILASRSCVRSGAGLVTLGCPRGLNTVFETSLTEVMTLPLEDCDGAILPSCADKVAAFSKKSDCVLYGPGLSVTEGTEYVLKNLISEYDKTLVIDADGINSLSRNIDILKKHKAEVILTPHPGEFSRLTGLSVEQILSDTERYASEFSAKYGVVTVLKSHKTVVALPDGKVWVNIMGNPGMATGGSGDVLAGVISAFVSQGFGCANSALAGVYIHSLAADMASVDKGEYGLLPSDVVEYLPYAIKFSIG